MRTFNKLLFWAAFALAAVSHAGDLVLLSANLMDPAPCPGQLTTLHLKIQNTNAFLVPPGHVLAAVEAQATHPSCTTFNAATETDKWWVINAGSSLSTAITPTQAFSVDGGYNIGGVAVSATIDLYLPMMMPSAAVYGASYKVHVQLDDNYATDSNGSPSCVAFNACLPDPAVSNLRLRVEGAPANGQPQLLWLDYDIYNTAAPYVRVTVPACENILSSSPQPYNGAPAAVAGQTVTWRLPDSSAAGAYHQKGSLFVMMLPTGCSGTLSLTPEYELDNLIWQPANTVAESLGSALLTVTKTQLNGAGIPSVSLNNGDTVQYVINYSASGGYLTCFDSFDAYTVGTYSGAVGGSAFGGSSSWKFGPDGGTPAWAILSDTTGDRYAQFQGSTSDYRELVLDCPAAKANGEDLCAPYVVQADVRHDDTDVNGDIGITLRGDDGAFPRAYILILSGDLVPGPGTGHLIIQRNNGTSGAGCCTWPAANTGGIQPLQNEWYTLKAMEQPLGTFYAKYWHRGDPEPTGWQLIWNDPSPMPCMSAGDGAVWSSGLRGFANHASFNNFRVFGAASLTGLKIWDSIPAGVDYVSANPPANGSVPSGSGSNEGALRWDFTGNNFGAVAGIIYNASGSFTWTGVVDCAESAGPVINQAGASTSSPALSFVSNSTSLNIVCAGTATVTQTGTPTSTPIIGTATVTYTPTPSWSPTGPSATVTRTLTPAGPSATSSATPSRTPSFTSTPTPTPGGPSPTTTLTMLPGQYAWLVPDTGPDTGGTFVTIYGGAFWPSSTVYFDGLTMTGMSFVNDHMITGYTPAHAAGPVTVRVDNGMGFATDHASAFTYIAGGPTPTSTATSTPLAAPSHVYIQGGLGGITLIGPANPLPGAIITVAFTVCNPTLNNVDGRIILGLQDQSVPALAATSCYINAVTAGQWFLLDGTGGYNSGVIPAPSLDNNYPNGGVMGGFVGMGCLAFSRPVQIPITATPGQLYHLNIGVTDYYQSGCQADSPSSGNRYILDLTLGNPSTLTPTLSASLTSTPSLTPSTPSMTPTPSTSPIGSPNTATLSPTLTAYAGTATVSPTWSITPGGVSTATMSPTPTAYAGTATVSPTRSITPGGAPDTATTSPTPTAYAGTATVSATFTMTFGAPANTGTITQTRSPTPTKSPTLTPLVPPSSATITPTSTATASPTLTRSMTFTRSPTVVNTGTVTMTVTRTLTVTPTATPTVPTGPLPDLVPLSIAITLYPVPACVVGGEALGTLVRVKNQGSADAGPFTLGLYDAVHNLGAQSVGGLAAGAVIDVWLSGVTFVGTNIAVVDSAATVVEADESNNQLMLTLPVPTPPPFCPPSATVTPTITPSASPTASPTAGPCDGSAVDFLSTAQGAPAMGNGLNDGDAATLSYGAVTGAQLVLDLGAVRDIHKVEDFTGGSFTQVIESGPSATGPWTNVPYRQSLNALGGGLFRSVAGFLAPLSTQFLRVTWWGNSGVAELKVFGCPSAIVATPTLPAAPGGGPGSYVYPNPASGGSGSILVTVAQPGLAHIEILNAGGSLVSTLDNHVGKGDTSLPLDLGGFAPGVYYYQVRLAYDDGTSQVLSVQTFMVVP